MLVGVSGFLGRYERSVIIKMFPVVKPLSFNYKAPKKTTLSLLKCLLKW